MKKNKAYSRTNDPAKKRTHTLSARFNDAELAQITARKGKLTSGEWLRSASLGRPIPNPIPAVNIELWSELGKIGANINQIAHQLNKKPEILNNQQNVDIILNEIKELRTYLLGD